MNEYRFIIFTPNFLDERLQFLRGGQEIHLAAVIDILLSHGYCGKVVQRSQTGKPFKVEIKPGLTVEGVPARNRFLLNWHLRKYLKNASGIIYFNELALAFPVVNSNSLVVCHGVAWDTPYFYDPELVPDSKLAYYLKIYAFRYYHMFNCRYAVKHAKRILSVDSSLLRIVQHERPNYRDKIHVIPNFVDTDVFKPKDAAAFRAALLEKYRIPSSNKLVLVPRNISYQRGVHILVKIAQTLPDNYTLLLAGRFIASTGGEKYYTYLQNKITQNHLENKLIILGSIDHEAMVDYYNAADLVLVPSFFGEGTSLAALEAMACKKIVIATNIGGLNDLILDGFNGFLVTPDAAAFVRKIRSIENNDALTEQLSENGYRLANDVFSKRKWEQKIVEFFELPPRQPP